MKPLYELADNYEQLFDSMYDETTGEINEQAISKIDMALQDVKEKGVMVAKYIQTIDGYKKSIDDECKRLADRKKKLEKKMDWLHWYLKKNMEVCNIQEISCPFFTIKIKKNPLAVTVTDPDQIPDEYINVKEVASIDKIKIKQALQDGCFVPGVELSQGYRLDIK